MSVVGTGPLIGWQTLLADLSLILFMVTAAAMADSVPGKVAKPAVPPHAQATQAPSQRGEPIAVWRAGAGAPPLRQWLRDEQPDARQQLTIAVHFSPVPGALSAALARASALAREAEEAGSPTRMLVEPGADEVVATLAYDRSASVAGPAGRLARPLQGGAGNLTQP